MREFTQIVSRFILLAFYATRFVENTNVFLVKVVVFKFKEVIDTGYNLFECNCLTTHLKNTLKLTYMGKNKFI